MSDQQEAPPGEPPSWGRDNYKKWPWGSFLIAAVSIGTIFFIAGSPQTIGKAEGVHLALSIGFLVVGSILLLPSLVAIIILIWIATAKSTGCCLPWRIRNLIRIVNGHPHLSKKELEQLEQEKAATAAAAEAMAKDNGASTGWSVASAEPPGGMENNRPPTGGYTNLALERDLYEEEQLDFTQGELVLNVQENSIQHQRYLEDSLSNHSSGAFPTSSALPPGRRNNSSSRGTRRTEPQEEVLPLEDVRVWTVPIDNGNDVRTHPRGPHWNSDVPTHDVISRRTDISHRSGQGWIEPPPPSRRNGYTSSQHRNGPSLNRPQHFANVPPNRQQGRKGNGRDQKSKPTLLSLSQSYIDHSNSARGSRVTSRSSSPQTIYIVNPQRRPVKDSLI